MGMIDTLEKLVKFEEHEIEGLGKIRILKPTLDTVDQIEALSEGKESMDTVKAQIRFIGLNSIVGADNEPEFTEENIDKLLDAPAAILVSIVNAFSKMVNANLEDTQKKQ